MKSRGDLKTENKNPNSEHIDQLSKTDILRIINYEDQTVAKNFTAQCTPDFFLFNSDSELIYRGQFDFSRPGNDKPVTGESLAQAVDTYLNSNETISPQYPSMGCNIKWKIDEEPDYFLEVKG